MSDIATDMYDHAKAAGASIHSDSWGGNTPAFDVQTNQVDSYAWNNLKFLPMFAAGNEGQEAEANTPRIQTVKRISTQTEGALSAIRQTLKTASPSAPRCLTTQNPSITPR